MKLIISVFKNSYKKEGSNQPDYKVTMINAKGGFENIGGGWIKSTKTGDKYISLSIDTEPETKDLTAEENAKIKALREAEMKKDRTLKTMEINPADEFNNF